MSSILANLEGSYAYLLTVQIIIVTGLFMVLLALIVRRIRLAAETKVAQSQPSAPVQAATEQLANTIEQSVQAVAAIQEKVTSLEQAPPPTESTPAPEGNRNLEEKVRYLDSKLLEYEILQEEISSLSALKIENEQLKSKLKEFEGGSPPQTQGDAKLAEMETPVLQEETKLEPTFDSKETLAAAAEVREEPTPSAPEPPEPEPEEPPPGASGSDTLESLLDQIDALTKGSPTHP
jgi:hypothetical protein